MSVRSYLDYNATAPVRPEVMDAVLEALGFIGNASSVHAEGRSVHGIIERARDRVAQLINVRPQDVIFTSGGTEANNMVFAPALWERIIVSPIEHSSVLEPAYRCGAKIVSFPVTADGVIDLAWWGDYLAGQEPGSLHKSLVSVQLANNETGVLQHVERLGADAREHGFTLHVDAVQAVGKVPVDFATLGADFMSLSAHKVGGPQGVGALVQRAGKNLPVLLRGGGQERGQRAGTQNLPGIAGFGMAAVLAKQELPEMDRVAELRDELEQGIRSVAPHALVIGANQKRLPNTSCFAVTPMKAETTVIVLDLSDIAISAGAACSSGKVERSHVLTAMGVDEEYHQAAVRVSLGWATRREEIENFLSAWTATYEKQRACRSAA